MKLHRCPTFLSQLSNVPKGIVAGHVTAENVVEYKILKGWRAVKHTVKYRLESSTKGLRIFNYIRRLALQDSVKK